MHGLVVRFSVWFLGQGMKKIEKVVSEFTHGFPAHLSERACQPTGLLPRPNLSTLSESYERINESCSQALIRCMEWCLCQLAEVNIINTFFH